MSLDGLMRVVQLILVFVGTVRPFFWFFFVCFFSSFLLIEEKHFLHVRSTTYTFSYSRSLSTRS